MASTTVVQTTAVQMTVVKTTGALKAQRPIQLTVRGMFLKRLCAGFASSQPTR